MIYLFEGELLGARSPFVFSFWEDRRLYRLLLLAVDGVNVGLRLDLCQRLNPSLFLPTSNFEAHLGLFIFIH